MRVLISYPFGSTELDANERNKKLFSATIEEGFNSRKIIETCLSQGEPAKFIPFIERIEQSSHNHYSTCFCMLVEKAAGIKVDDKVQVIRTIILELERLYSHSIYLGRLFGHTDNHVLINHSITLKDSLLDLFEEVCGHRMYGTASLFGDINFNVSTGNTKRILQVVDSVGSSLVRIRKTAVGNPSFVSLFEGNATISENDIRKNSLTGPFSWYKGLNTDARKTSAYLAYPSFKGHTHSADNGNCMYRRMLGIMDDMEASVEFIHVLATGEDPTYQSSKKLVYPELTAGTYSNAIESPRGLLSMSMEVNKDGKITAVKIVSPSDINKRMIYSSLDGTPSNFIIPAFESLYISMMEIDK